MSRALFTETFGDGPDAVLFLHGLFGSGRNLATLARRLVERAPAVRAVTVDLTGHGQSPPLPDPPRLEHLAEDILAVIAATGAKRLVGHSLGGRAALAARRLDPAAVPDILLLDIPPGPGDPDDPAHYGALAAVRDALLAAPPAAPDRPSMAAFLRERRLSEPLVQWLLLNLQKTPAGVSWRIDRERLAALQAASAADDLWPVIEQRAGATRLIRGGASPFVTEADVARLEAAGVPVTTLPGAGHFVHVDAPEVIVQAI